MQVDSVGHARGHTAQATTVDREEGLEHGVDADQQRAQGRDLAGVPQQQQHCQLGIPEPQEVGAPVTQKDQACGEVPDEEAQRGAHGRQRKRCHEVIAGLVSHVGQRCQHDGRTHRRQPVEAVDDVDRVGEACHHQHGDEHAASRDAHQRVHPRQRGMAYEGAKEPGREQGCQHGGQQPRHRTDLLREVLRQASHDHWHGAEHEPPSKGGRRIRRHGQRDQCGDGPRHDTQPAGARDRCRVELLGPVQLPVQGPAVRRRG